MKIFIFRLLFFSAVSFILIFSGQILYQYYPDLVAPYASVIVGLLIAGLYTLWEG